MGILDIFSRKKPTQKESNSLFGQQQLGNQIALQGNSGTYVGNNQLLYVTTASTTDAGRTVNVTTLSRNSTVMSCVGIKARTLAQCGISIMYKTEDGTFEDALKTDKAGLRDKNKARQVLNLLQNPNNFQSQYEFFYQLSQWLDLTGETYTLLWRKDQTNPSQTPIEAYNLDSTLKP